MNSSATVCTQVGLRLVVPGRPPVPLVASLSYGGHDPYAVRMAFHVSADDTVEWIFARELLRGEPESAKAGGDVHVWPAAGTGGEVLNISLCSPSGQALFEAPATEVATFVERTYELVPAGQEGEFADIESEIDDLLWQY